MFHHQLSAAAFLPNGTFYPSSRHWSRDGRSKVESQVRLHYRSIPETDNTFPPIVVNKPPGDVGRHYRLKDLISIPGTDFKEMQVSTSWRLLRICILKTMIVHNSWGCASWTRYSSSLLGSGQLCSRHTLPQGSLSVCTNVRRLWDWASRIDRKPVSHTE